MKDAGTTAKHPHDPHDPHHGHFHKSITPPAAALTGFALFVLR